MTRTAAVTKLWAYIKANGLQQKIEGKLGVKCDEKLKVLFGEDAILASKMTKALKKHFLKKKGYATTVEKNTKTQSHGKNKTSPGSATENPSENKKKPAAKRSQGSKDTVETTGSKSQGKKGKKKNK